MHTYMYMYIRTLQAPPGRPWRRPGGSRERYGTKPRPLTIQGPFLLPGTLLESTQKCPIEPKFNLNQSKHFWQHASPAVVAQTSCRAWGWAYGVLQAWGRLTRTSDPTWPSWYFPGNYLEMPCFWPKIALCHPMGASPPLLVHTSGRAWGGPLRCSKLGSRQRAAQTPLGLPGAFLETTWKWAISLPILAKIGPRPPASHPSRQTSHFGCKPLP